MDVPYDRLQFSWRRIWLFAASPLLLAPLAFVVQYFLNVPLMGQEYVLDSTSIVSGVLYSVPWVLASLLPIEKVPGLSILGVCHVPLRPLLMTTYPQCGPSRLWFYFGKSGTAADV